MDPRPETFPWIAVITEYYCVMYMLLHQCAEGGDKPPSQSWFRFWPVSEYSMGVKLNPAFLCTRPGAMGWTFVITPLAQFRLALNKLDIDKQAAYIGLRHSLN
jgi:hypothetical protein